MGALRQPKLSESKQRKPAKESRDQFGRDPESPLEKLRGLSNLKAQTGFSPLFDAILADWPRLSSGHVCDMIILHVNRLSYGRFRDSAKDPRYTATLPISSAELAELCRCNVRDIQRQLREMEARGMISIKTVKLGGSVKYAISLLYADWQAIEDYAVWKRRQVVEIDDVETDEGEDDTAPPEVSKDATQLFRKAQSVRPGRATKAVKVEGGVKEVVCQNDSPTVDMTFSAVLTSGRLVFSAKPKTGEVEAKGEQEANADRRTRRALPPNEGSREKRSKSETHPRSSEIVNLFDPLLQKSGSRLLSPDFVSLQLACAEVGAMPHDALVYWVMKEGGRGSRPISGPRTVAAIVREARQNWEAGKVITGASEGRRCGCGGEIITDGLCSACLEKLE